MNLDVIIDKIEKINFYGDCQVCNQIMTQNITYCHDEVGYDVSKQVFSPIFYSLLDNIRLISKYE